MPIVRRLLVALLAVPLVASALAAAPSPAAAGQASADARAAAEQWTLTLTQVHRVEGGTGFGSTKITFQASWQEGGSFEANAPFSIKGEVGGHPYTTTTTLHFRGRVEKPLLSFTWWSDEYEICMATGCTKVPGWNERAVAMRFEDGAEKVESVDGSTLTWKLAGRERWRLTMDVRQVLWGGPAPRLPRGHRAGLKLWWRLEIVFERDHGAWKNGKGKLTVPGRTPFSVPAGRYRIHVSSGGQFPKSSFSTPVTSPVGGRTVMFTLPRPNHLRVLYYLLARGNRISAIMEAGAETPVSVVAAATEYERAFVPPEAVTAYSTIFAGETATSQAFSDALWKARPLFSHVTVAVTRLA